MLEQRTKYAIDWITVCLYLVLVVCGWVSVYGASYNYDQTDLFNFDYRWCKQMVWIAGALVLGAATMLIDWRFFERFSYLFYALVLLVLIVTPFVAPEIKGSRSWITIGPVSIQPAELAKIATAMAIAKFMNQYGYKVNSLKDLIVPFIMLAVPMFIIMVPQQETGSALVFAALVLMFYREGMTPVILLLGVAAVAFFVITIAFGDSPLPLGGGTWGITASMLLVLLVIFVFMLNNERAPKHAFIIAGISAGLFAVALVVNIWLPVRIDYVSIGAVVTAAIYLILYSLSHNHRNPLWVALFAVGVIFYSFSANMLMDHLQPHQRNRIKVTLGVTEDPVGQGYNVNQAKIAIGSGGLTGKGLGGGTQTKLKYVPEQDTDFIFCTVGEEHGFLGALFVLSLYLILLLRLVFLAERQRDNYSRIYGYCVASYLFFHLAINVGMVIGIVPVIGIPLPFFSYGGSSLWSFTLMLFIFIRLDSARMDRL